jgi:hypothetical protein
MFEKDYIMRQISLAVQVAARLIFGKHEPVYQQEDKQNPTGGDLLYAEIMRLFRENKINEAEDALFDQLDSGISSLPEIATDFYYRLSLLPDEELEASGFSRAEIDQGLTDFMTRCGISLPIPAE